MSTPPQNPVPSPGPLPAHKPSEPEREEIKIVSHSTLFYWWPVWAVGFLMALLTWLDGHRMAVVPEGTTAHRVMEVQTTAEGKPEKHEVLIVPRDEKHPKHLPSKDPAGGPAGDPAQPELHMAHTGTYGVIFLITLLLCIVITNVPLRGMWSVVIIISIVLLSVIFGLAGWWERIIHTLGLLDIRINMAGYLFVSGVLFAIWLITFIFFDQQMYIIFTPKQMKVRTEIGGGEEVFDTAGMTFKKQRSDLFRHWILGLGSGDLVVNTTGAGVHHFDLPNVLFIGKKVQDIERVLALQRTERGR